MAVNELFGDLPSSWESTTLGEICARNGGDIQTGPFGSQLHASDYVPVGIPAIMPVNIGDNRVIEEGIVRVRPEDAQRLSRYLVKTGDIVYSRRGDVERRALITPHENGWLCGTGCLRVRLGSGSISPLFASYYLGHPGVRAWIVRHAIGATMPNLNTSILSALPFVFPPIKEQERIAEILGTLDAKIALNRRLNATLEALARALFQSWFVDFDPVRAKAAGRQPAGMDAATAALFPDGFEETEMGEVPRGWRVSTIGAEVDVVGGSTPSTSEPAYWEGGDIHWATPKDLAGLQAPVLLDTARMITEAGLNQIGSGLLPVGTVLLSSRAPVGYLAIAEVPLAINQGFIAMRCERQLPNSYVLNWAQANMEVIEGRANGTTFMEVSKSNFRTIPVIVPPVEILRVFQEVVGSWYAKITGNLREARTLAEMRDALLPRLMSGEVRVGESAADLETDAAD